MLVRKNIWVILLTCLMFFSLIGFGWSAKVAEAGVIYDTLYDGLAIEETLDQSLWYNSFYADYAGISSESKDNAVFIANDPQGGLGGCGINSKVAIPNNTDNLEININIDRLNFGTLAKSQQCGWFGLAYNLNTHDYTSGNAYLVGQGMIAGCGLYFTYHPQEGLIFAPIGVGVNAFYDGNDQLIPQRTQYAYYDANSLLTNVNDPSIEKITLIVKISQNGDFVLSTKPIGQTGDGEVKITASGFQPVEDGTYYGLSVHRSSVAISSVAISNFEVKADGQIINDFLRKNKSNWNFFKPSETTLGKFNVDYVMRFNEDFSQDYPLYLQKELVSTDGYESFVEFSATLDLGTVSSGSEFGVLFGVNNIITDSVGVGSSTYVSISESASKYYLGVKTYNENGELTTLVKNSNDDVNDNIEILEEDGLAKLYVKIDNQGLISIKLNDYDLYNSLDADADCYFEGFCGFAVIQGDNYDLDMGVCNVSLDNYYYAKPTTADVVEDFDSNGYNPNEFYLRIAPYMNNYTNSVYVNDGKLWFDNCAYNTSFSTITTYSDFSIQFDIDDIRRQPILDPAGGKILPVSSFVGVYWGVPSAETMFGDGVSSAYPLIYISSDVSLETWDRNLENGKPSPTRIYCMGNGMGSSFTLPEKYDFWDPVNEGKILQFRVDVKGDTAYIFVKYTDDQEWCNVDTNGNKLEIKMKKALVGSVGVSTMGNNYYVAEISEGASCGYFSLDNLSVKNLDDNPDNNYNVKDGTTYKELPKDFSYVKPNNEDDYLPVIGGSGCNASLLESSSLLVILEVVVVLSILFMRRSKHAKKDS